MLYIKTYEELTFEPKSVEWQKEKTSWGYQYSFEIDERPMSVTFDQVLEERFPSMYEREFKSGYNFDLLAIGANKVLSIVTAATYDFLKDNNPECIIIHHINVDREKTSFEKLNKRAKGSFNFLKDIKKYCPEYNLKYFSQKYINSSGSVVTICFIYKNSFDPYKVIEHFDRGQGKYTEINP